MFFQGFPYSSHLDFALEEEKKNQMAQHHKKMFELQQKIDNLLCLEFKQQENGMVLDITANDLPF